MPSSNNAGIAHAGHRPIEELTLADWNGMIASHLTGSSLLQSTPSLIFDSHRDPSSTSDRPGFSIRAIRAYAARREESSP